MRERIIIARKQRKPVAFGPEARRGQYNRHAARRSETKTPAANRPASILSGSAILNYLYPVDDLRQARALEASAPTGIMEAREIFLHDQFDEF
jgi:hypothetical protein